MDKSGIFNYQMISLYVISSKFKGRLRVGQMRKCTQMMAALYSHAGD